jgi:ADP-ribosylglycohydrolase
MFGAIIGDIAGSRFEFNNYLNTDFEFFTNECNFTDDSICTIAIADALLKGISFEKSLLHWCRKYPNPKGAYGGSFGAWVCSENPTPYYSFGNGSAMRVSPCAWLSNDRETVLRNAHLSAQCTHNHPEGIKGAIVIADCIYQARQNYCSKAVIQALASNEYAYSLDMTCDEIRRTNTFNETCQVTVPQAILCFLESSDFESAIRLAISIGGDSDTIAAITGSIAEAFYGIPEHIKIQALRYLPQEFIDIIDSFYKHIEK